MSKRKWEEDLLKDFNALADAYKSGQLDPKDVVNVPLPSGRVLHNPAKRKVKDATRWASQQIDNAKAASKDWLDGVKNPARDPVSAAIDAKEKWADKVQTAIKEGKFEKGLSKTSHREIVSIAEKVGTTGYESGVEARRDKVKRVVDELQPLSQAVSDSIQAMPDKTDADREKRLLAARKAMIELGKKR